LPLADREFMACPLYPNSGHQAAGLRCLLSAIRVTSHRNKYCL
jgi:hypothetical protein